MRDNQVQGRTRQAGRTPVVRSHLGERQAVHSHLGERQAVHSHLEAHSRRVVRPEARSRRVVRPEADLAHRVGRRAAARNLLVAVPAVDHILPLVRPPPAPPWSLQPVGCESFGARLDLHPKDSKSLWTQCQRMRKGFPDVCMQRWSRALMAGRLVACFSAAGVPGLTACKAQPERPPPSAASHSIQRGDRVVVEPRAAEFFEGTVLAVTAGQLRVAPRDGPEPVRVALADAYRLPAQNVSARVGQLAVCRIDASWLGCRVASVAAPAMQVRTPDGLTHAIQHDALLLPSPLTELNLERHFARTAERSAFIAAAAAAGEPVAPVGFRSLPKARVIVRRRGAWESAVVSEVGKKDLYVTFTSDGLKESVTTDIIIPEPPYSAPPRRGQFALVRPTSPSEAWPRVQVTASTEGAFKVRDAEGTVRVVGERDLVPLSTEP